MTSPLIVERMGVPEGKLRGKAAIRSYWAKGLASAPGLSLRLLDVAGGVNVLAIVYESATLQRVVVERIEFDRKRLGVRAEALHGPRRQAP